MLKISANLGLEEKNPSPGAEDFEVARAKILEFKNQKGATVVFKPPGYNINDEGVIVPDHIKGLLKKDDLFIFVMLPIQMKLLKEFGDVVGTDGTHAVFNYNDVKLIAVHVASFKPGASEDMKERGFPVAIALVRSEREEIHKAIALMLKSAVPEWSPKLLMTDMAFSAFNAWSSLFPQLRWLWCVFHVLQAWLRHLNLMSNPGNISKEEWGHAKRKVTKEIKSIICSKTMGSEEFESRVADVREVLLAMGQTDVVRLWDSYVAKRERWASHERHAVIAQIFGSATRMPIFGRSNNPVEGFFNSLKYSLLGGRCLRTISEFFKIWSVFETRLYSDALVAGVIDHLENKEALSKREALHVHRGLQELEVDQNINADTENEDEENDDDVVGVAGEEQSTGGNVAYAFAEEGDEDDDEDAQELQAQWQAKQLKEKKIWLQNLHSSLVSISREMLEYATLIEQNDVLFDDGDDLNRIRSFAKVLDNIKSTGRALFSRHSTLDPHFLHAVNENQEFVRQKDNYTPQRFVPGMHACNATHSSADGAIVFNSSSQVSTLIDSTKIVEQCTQLNVACVTSQSNGKEHVDSNSQERIVSVFSESQKAERSEITSHVGEAVKIDDKPQSSQCGGSLLDVDLLYKRQKRQKMSLNDRNSDSHTKPSSFAEFAKAFTSESANKSRAENSQRLLQEACMPFLRTALCNNSKVRIRAVMYDTLGVTFPNSISKGELVTRALGAICDIVSVPREISGEVADIGIIHTSAEGLPKGSIVLFKSNSTSSTGEPCVASCMSLSGWVVISNGSHSYKELSWVESIDPNVVYWGHLIERRKALTIIESF